MMMLVVCSCIIAIARDDSSIVIEVMEYIYYSNYKWLLFSLVS